MEERFGPWLLGRRVAVGNFADVTEASRGDEVVALKRLHAHSARDPELRALFLRESRIATSVPSHPGLVAGIGVGDVEGRPWLAMPLVAGADLRRCIDRGDKLDARALVTDIAGALDHLHGSGWIHGDVNPSNILVAPGTQPLLCDFGVARPPGEPGPVRGTHAYMAPEQVRGAPWTPATDVFALGVVLWELVAGARLFLRDATWLTMAAAVEAEAPPLDDPALDAIAKKALAKDPAERFATAGALGAALQ